MSSALMTASSFFTTPPLLGSALRLAETQHQVDRVPDRTQLAQVCLVHARVGELLNLHGHVDGVDAVELEVVHQPCLERDALCRDLEVLDQRLANALEYLVPGHRS